MKDYDYREYIRAYMKYYMRERNSNLYYCECGSVIRINSRCLHFKTKKHKKYLRERIIVEPSLTLQF